MSCDIALRIYIYTVVKRRLQTTPIAEQIGSVKIVLSGDAASHGGDEEGVNHAYERAQNFLKEQLFGDRHKRVPGMGNYIGTPNASRYG